MSLSFFTFWKSLLILLGITAVSLIFDDQTQEPEAINWAEIAFKTVLISPIIETFIFQFIPVKGLHYFNKTPNLNQLFLLIILSSLFFGITHVGSLSRIIFSFLKGIILIIFFIKINESKSLTKAFWLTSTLHSLYNLLIYLTLLILYSFFR